MTKFKLEAVVPSSVVVVTDIDTAKVRLGYQVSGRDYPGSNPIPQRHLPLMAKADTDPMPREHAKQTHGLAKRAGRLGGLGGCLASRRSASRGAARLFTWSPTTTGSRFAQQRCLQGSSPSRVNWCWAAMRPTFATTSQAW